MANTNYGDDTKEQIERHKLNCVAVDKTKYSRSNEKQLLYFRRGRDLLQYTIVVRPFIMQKYLIKEYRHLEILLYLFPIQHFTTKDFKILPMRQFNITMNVLIELGYVEITVQRKGRASHIYGLTSMAKNIVVDYYAYLSGEKVIKTKSPFYNPFAKKPSQANKMREKVMLKLKQQAENWSKDFRERFY